MSPGLDFAHVTFLASPALAGIGPALATGLADALLLLNRDKQPWS